MTRGSVRYIYRINKIDFQIPEMEPHSRGIGDDYLNGRYAN